MRLVDIVTCRNKEGRTSEHLSDLSTSGNPITLSSLDKKLLQWFDKVNSDYDISGILGVFCALWETIKKEGRFIRPFFRLTRSWGG